MLYTLRDVVGGAVRNSNAKHSLPPARFAPKTDGSHARYFRSDRTGLWMYRRSWKPAPSSGGARAQGTVYLLHGYGEHIGRYEKVAAALADAGFVVHGMDHRAGPEE